MDRHTSTSSRYLSISRLVTAISGGVAMGRTRAVVRTALWSEGHGKVQESAGISWGEVGSEKEGFFDMTKLFNI